MNLSLLTLSIWLSLSLAQDHEHGICTHGRLFLADSLSSEVHVMDMDEMAMIESASFTVPGGQPQILETTSTTASVAAIYRGRVENRYLDGSVHFYSSGLEFEFHVDHWDILEGNPVYLADASFSCARPIHVVPHDNKIAIFCDGFFSPAGSTEQQVNTTVWLIDENRFTSSTQNPIILTETLQGSHHGVAVPIDDNHLLISRATTEHIQRVEGVSSLPDGFTVQDYQGNEIHNLNQENDRARSCPGYHGSTAQGNTFALACDATHGGIVVVDYNDKTERYSSSPVDYPSFLQGVRTGSFAEHHMSEWVVGNLASPDKTYLLAFNPKGASFNMFESRHLLELSTTPCSFQFEKGIGEHLLVWMPDGMLNIYEINPGWKLVDSVQVVPGMTQCSSGFLIAGYGHAVIVEGRKIHAIELIELYHQDEVGPLTVQTTLMSFIPGSAVITGVSVDELACEVEEAEEETSFGGGLCFPGEASVLVQEGNSNITKKRMRDLTIGDMIQVSATKFEPIYSFGHLKEQSKHEYLRLNAAEYQLVVSTEHMVHANGHFVPAGEIRVGDKLRTAEGNSAVINSINKLQAQGAFAPFTPSGELIVDGILVSSFAAVADLAVDILGTKINLMHHVAHAFEFPHRVMCHYTRLLCPKETYTAEGISTWAAKPLEISLWMMEQIFWVRGVFLTVVMGIFVTFAVIELSFVYPVVVLAFILGVVSMKAGKVGKALE